MSGEIYFGIPGLIGAALVLAVLAVIVRYVPPGPSRSALLMLVGAAFTYGLGDGLARLAAASNDASAAHAWFTVRFFGISMVPAAFLHLAGASTGLIDRIWFRPVLALVYTVALVGILVRVGTPYIISNVMVVNQTLSVQAGPGYQAFGLYGLGTSVVAAFIYFRYAREAPTAAARARARLSGVAVLFPFGAATLFFLATHQGASPTFDPLAPFLTGAVIVLAGFMFAREVPAATLSAIRTIFASLPDGIVIADRRGLVTFSNPAANDMLGVSGAGLEGEPLHGALDRAALPPELRQKLQEALRQVDAGELPLTTLSIEVPGPPSRALRAVVARAEVGGARPPSKRLEQERDRFVFIALHEETEARSREIMLSRANEVKDLFISMIGHDLKAPLTAISGYGELIALDANSTPDGLAVYRYAQSILGSARQIQLMMENARLFSRLVDPQDILRSREPVDLKALLQKEIQNLRQAAERRRVTLDAALGEGAGHAVVYAAPIIRSVFQNLIDNAIKYTGEGTKVTVHVTREPSTALVEVIDEGPGIPADKRDAIFRRFTRLEQTRTKTEGLGLGLAIARQLVELHGGSITVGNRPDGQPGARFEVRLPLAAGGKEGTSAQAREEEK